MRPPVRMLRLSLRPVIPAVLVCVAGWWLASRLAAVPSAGTEQGLWQDGVWQLQQSVAEKVLSVLKVEARKMVRASVSVRVGPGCPWSFSSLTSAELAQYLRKRCADSVAADVEIAPVIDGEGAAPADLTIELTVVELAQREDGEELCCTLTLTGAGGVQSTSTLRAACPAGYRNWFVRPRSVPVFWLIATAAMGVVGAGVLCNGAWQAFLRKYAGGARMWCGAVLLLSGAGFLFATWIVAPTVRPVDIPLAQTRVVLEASDAALFESSSGPEALNPQAHFILSFLTHLQNRLRGGEPQENEKRAGEAAGGAPEEKQPFWPWVCTFLIDLLAGDAEPDTIRFRAAREMQLDGIVTGRAGSSQLVRIPFDQLRRMLRCGRLGRETCFVLPWEAMGREATGRTERERLVVLLHTGNVGSLEQAYELERTLEQRCQTKPKTMRILSIMLLDVRRSKEPFESQEQRARRLCGAGDYFLSLNDAYRPTASVAGQCQLLPLTGLIDDSEAEKPSGESGGHGEDLDAKRDRCFGGIPPSKCEQSARKLAEYVLGLLAWDRVPVFDLNRDAVWAMLAIAALLLLFLSLQDELTVLDTHEEPPRGQWLGHLLGLGLGTLGCLYFFYCLQDASAWTTRGSCGLALWSLGLVWYSTLWLPHFLGRGAGNLPPPAVGLHMRLSFWLLAAATLAILATFVAGVVVRMLTGFPVEFSLAGKRGYPAGSCLAGLSVALLLTLNAWFLRNRFARGHRKWIVRAGAAAGGLLLAWPWLAPWLDGRQAFSIPLVVWVWLGVFAVLYLQRWGFADRTQLERAAGRWDPGWRWLAFVLVAVPVVIGNVREPFLAVRLAETEPSWIAPAHDWVTCLATLLFAAVLLLAVRLPGVLREIGWWGARWKRYE